MPNDQSSQGGATPIGQAVRRRREGLLQQLLEAQNSNDVTGALACFVHPRYELVGNSRVYDGADEVRRYYETTRRYFPDMTFELVSLHHADDAVVAELMMSGTHLGSGTDFEASGKQFHCRAAAVFLFEGDGLVCVRAYYDTGTIARQLA
jgi:steroid delta-isomerase-like uncharacterized protein